MGTYNPDTTDWTRPAHGVIAITAGAGALSRPIRGLYIAETGDVAVTLMDGTTATFENLAAGVIHPLACTHVTSAGGATGILGVY